MLAHEETNLSALQIFMVSTDTAGADQVSQLFQARLETEEMTEGTIPGTIIGGHIDRHAAVFTVLDNGVITELVITPDVLVLPDEGVLAWDTVSIETE